jgi:hypothetical protein
MIIKNAMVIALFLALCDLACMGGSAVMDILIKIPTKNVVSVHQLFKREYYLKFKIGLFENSRKTDIVTHCYRKIVTKAW